MKIFLLFLILISSLSLFSCESSKAKRPLTYVKFRMSTRVVADQSGNYQFEVFRIFDFPKRYYYCNNESIPKFVSKDKQDAKTVSLIFKVYNKAGEEIHRQSGFHEGNEIYHLKYLKGSAFFRVFLTDKNTGLEIREVSQMQGLFSLEEILRGRRGKYRVGDCDEDSCHWLYYDDCFKIVLPV